MGFRKHAALPETSIGATIHNLQFESQFAKTQKARGLVQSVLQLQDFYMPNSIGMLPNFGTFFIIKSEDDIDRLMNWGGFDALNGYHTGYSVGLGKWFVRPCPTTPKHGFVESRSISTEDELRQIWKETREADPDGEMIFCERLNALGNAVLTPNSITLGLGHDGATSGKGVVVLPVTGETVPTEVVAHQGMYHKEMKPFDAKELGINDTPYIELVYGIPFDGYNLAPVYLTQLRDGPAIAGLKDIIPAEVVVARIIEVDPNLIEDPTALLKWDKMISGLKGENGVVVYHKGGSPTSHFGVHCAIHKVPYVTTFEPVVGQKLEPTTAENKLDYSEIREGLILGLSADYSRILSGKLDSSGELSHKQFQSMLVSALYAMHATALLGKDESKFLGYAIANLIRLATSACLGELRHFPAIVRKEGKRQRHEVYKKYAADIEQGLAKLRFTYEIFAQGSWSDSFGGKNWANCTDLTIQLVNAVLRFYHRTKDRRIQDLPGVPSAAEKLFQVVQTRFNELINAVHNGGLFLNKFASNDLFDLAKNNLALFAARTGMALKEQVEFCASFEPASKKIVREKLIASKLYRKEKRIVEALLNLNICGNCGSDDSLCSCSYCDDCENYSCTCDKIERESHCDCSECNPEPRNEIERDVA